MYTENHVEFNDELINRTGYYLWMHSTKCKHIRIGFYIAMLVSTLLAIVGFFKYIFNQTDKTMMILFIIVDVLLFGAITLIWPLVFRSRVINSIHSDISQIITMDENFVNLHTTISHQQYKWNTFIDIEEDDKYYFIFSPEVYIILCKENFPAGGEDIFRSLRTPARLIKSAERESKRERHLIIFTHDYLTPLVNFWNKITHKKNEA